MQDSDNSHYADDYKNLIESLSLTDLKKDHLPHRANALLLFALQEQWVTRLKPSPQPGGAVMYGPSPGCKK